METRVAIEDYLFDCQYRALAPATIRLYRWVLERLVATCPELPEEPGPIQELITLGGFALETRYDIWRMLRTFFRWMDEYHRIVNPMRNLRPPRTRPTFPRTLSEKELVALFAAAKNRRDVALIAVAVDTGARRGELASMTWPNITGSGIRVEGKTGSRSLPLSPNVKQLLIGQGTEIHVWLGRSGQPLTASGVAQSITRAMSRAGILPPKAGPHLLRHTFGKWYIMKGGDVFSLQRIMGHRSVETTMIYVSMNTEDLIEQHSKFSPMANLHLLPTVKEMTL